jgi:peptidoglycan/xylan/chitin deacetylase (PgdA/CDA1 family)
MTSVRSHGPLPDGRGSVTHSEQSRDRQGAVCGSESRALILMYHRVTTVNADPFALCVSPPHFAEHLQVLRKHTSPVSLRRVLESLSGKRIPPHSVTITFDDGYADNLHNARPLLERSDIPATVFVTSGFVGQDHEFWWDELESIFLEPGHLPSSLSLTISGVEHRWDLGESASRQEVYFELWRLLQLLPEWERTEVLESLAVWGARGRAARPNYRGLSAKELQSLSANDSIEIGAHTVTHPSLPELAVAAQRSEVQKSKATLEDILGRPVTSFAYPYGASSDESMEIVREAGFRCACTADPGFVDTDPDLFQLPRVQVENWDGEEFEKRLISWLGWAAIVPERRTSGEILIRGKWSFRTARGNTARLMFPSGDRDLVRVAIEKAGTERFDIQLNQPRLGVSRNRTYRITFSARADGPRTISVGFALAHEPWTGLGLYETVELVSDWRPFELRFTPQVDEADGRIHFDLGGNDSSVEFAGIAIQEAGCSG